ncbi:MULTISPECIES: MFS transporter [Pseudonocardia]|uniref:MFS transporter n=2 Tax=Pseudonocardia TaxID=1847 RepID=A0ABQ0S106_9PSEU|nr:MULTISPECIES: MFS transporter [Pseudonocardia]OSY36277.1 putative tartrate transporter [Pseudonocardia autotrophica]TDN73082.1 sugar phosphate permease [Pseudonocardia autotrophica]BBG03802.1 MFS transporter [Pseudonocardia autotrophica]GEC26590.1 MFS transporter [Pseudonocardia saturnea]
MPTGDSSETEVRDRLRKKILWRISPFLGLMYLVNYLDRTNLAFAAPAGMNADLGLTAAMFGLASGIFFLGYLLFEVPSNLALHRYGARRWLARILVSWGMVASLMAFVPNAGSLYVMRLLLGIAEAGFAPGVLLYLTYWFTKRDRVRAMALFLVAIPLTSVIGAPIAGMLIQWGDSIIPGFAGWRFMILMTGLPAIVLGVICWFYLTDRPADAKWLTEHEKALLSADLAEEQGDTTKSHRVRDALLQPRVWLLGMMYFGVLYGMYAIGFFLPTIIAGFQETFGVEYSTLEVGLLTAVPYGFAAIGMVLWARHSDLSNEVVRHFAVPALVGAVGILIAMYANSPFLSMVGVTIAATGILSSMPPFWGMPTRLLTGAAAASGIALVNTLGNASGFLGPVLTGWLADVTGDNRSGMWVILAFLFLSAVVSIIVFRSMFSTPDRADEFEERTV